MKKPRNDAFRYILVLTCGGGGGGGGDRRGDGVGPSTRRLLLFPWCLMLGDDRPLPTSYTGAGVGVGLGRGLAYSALPLPGCGTAADTSTRRVAASSAEFATFVSDLLAEKEKAPGRCIALSKQFEQQRPLLTVHCPIRSGSDTRSDRSRPCTASAPSSSLGT